jgi:hypothetical protein
MRAPSSTGWARALVVDISPNGGTAFGSDVKAPFVDRTVPRNDIHADFANRVDDALRTGMSHDSRSSSSPSSSIRSSRRCCCRSAATAVMVVRD